MVYVAAPLGETLKAPGVRPRAACALSTQTKVLMRRARGPNSLRKTHRPQTITEIFKSKERNRGAPRRDGSSMKAPPLKVMFTFFREIYDIFGVRTSSFPSVEVINLYALTQFFLHSVRSNELSQPWRRPRQIARRTSASLRVQRFESSESRGLGNMSAELEQSVMFVSSGVPRNAPS